MGKPISTPLWVAGLLGLGAPMAIAQQVVEIDYTAGRTIMDDEWRSMLSLTMAVDWDRRILYIADREEPEGVMAFSLETGEMVRMIAAPVGEGPYEFARGRTDISLVADGGLYVTGYQRVVEYDPTGEPVSSWSPRAPMSRAVCNLGGAPAVPTQGGVVRRGTDPDQDEYIGAVRADGEVLDTNTDADAQQVGMRLVMSRIACRDDRAYVVMSYDTGPDSVFVYHVDGEAPVLAVPTQGTEGKGKCEQQVGGVRRSIPCPIWSQNLQPSFDDHGNLVLLGADREYHGAIVNPETGCYALVRNTPGDRRLLPVRIYADSALVFKHSVSQMRFRGETHDVVDTNSADGISIHPLRHVSGEPCPGVLPSVGSRIPR